MTARRYKVLVEGVEASDLSLKALRDLCDVLIEGSTRSARLAAEGRSVAPGTVPAWISSAADLHVRHFASGSLDLGLDAPPFADVAPELFAQTEFWPSGLVPEDTALDLFLDAAADAVAAKRDSDRLDPGVLDVLAGAGALFGGGATRLTVSGGRRGTATRLDATTAKDIRTMAATTPASRIARVRGVLDSLTVSTQSLALKLESGTVLRGYAGHLGVANLKRLLGKEVVVEGPTTFRPSGDALRIEAEDVQLARPGDVIWAKLPHVDPVGTKPRALLAEAGAGLDALFGAWPGDETDEELGEALAEWA